MDRSESAEAPVKKSSQVVKKRDHTICELSRQLSAALEKVSEHLKHLAAPSANLAVPQAVWSKTSTNHQEISFLTPRESVIPSTFYDEDLGERLALSGHAVWASIDLHEIIQGLVDALSPLQTMMKVHEERIAALEAVQQTAQVQALAHRVLAVEISLASLNPSANSVMQTSWLSSVLTRLEALESSIAAISDNSDFGFAVSFMNHLSDLEASLAGLGTPGNNKETSCMRISRKNINCLVSRTASEVTHY